MSRIVVIGGTGHVGGYLVPRLVAAGHEVVSVSRGVTDPSRPHAAWDAVRRVELDRDAGDADGTFAGAVADLAPDAVVDMMCFTPSSAEQLVEALRGRAGMLLSCGTVWVHGSATVVPTTEDEARDTFGEYGPAKAEIEALLLAESRLPGGLPSTVLHPGHICGPGKSPINPVGNVDLEVWERLATGRTVVLPSLGLETLHHVHADDVAQAFALALERRDAAAGEAFHVVSERALTLRGFASAVAGWFGQEADLAPGSFETFRAQTTAEHAGTTMDHIARSSSLSIDKARRLLGYDPAYTSLRAVGEGLTWLKATGRVDLGGREPAVTG